MWELDHDNPTGWPNTLEVVFKLKLVRLRDMRHQWYNALFRWIRIYWLTVKKKTNKPNQQQPQNFESFWWFESKFILYHGLSLCFRLGCWGLFQYVCMCVCDIHIVHYKMHFKMSTRIHSLVLDAQNSHWEFPTGRVCNLRMTFTNEGNHLSKRGRRSREGCQEGAVWKGNSVQYDELFSRIS